MATLIQADGKITEVKPAKGKKFTLEEMQALVGGMVEHVPLRKRYKEFAQCWCNEEGKVMDPPLPTNEVAMLWIANYHHLNGPVVFTKAGEF